MIDMTVVPLGVKSLNEDDVFVLMITLLSNVLIISYPDRERLLSLMSLASTGFELKMDAIFDLCFVYDAFDSIEISPPSLVL